MITAKEAREISEDKGVFYDLIKVVGKNILVSAMNGESFFDMKEWRDINQGLWEFLSSNGYICLPHGTCMRIAWGKF